MIFDESGKQLFEKTSNQVDCVHFDQDEVEKMNGNILTHNHPGGTSFSAADISLMIINNLKEIRAVTLGGTFILKNINEVMEKKNFAMHYHYEMGEEKLDLDNQYEEFLEQYKEGLISKADFQTECSALNNAYANLAHNWLSKNSKRYGCEYYYEKRE